MVEEEGEGEGEALGAGLRSVAPSLVCLYFPRPNAVKQQGVEIRKGVYCTLRKPSPDSSRLHFCSFISFKA